VLDAIYHPSVFGLSSFRFDGHQSVLTPLPLLTLDGFSPLFFFLWLPPGTYLQGVSGFCPLFWRGILRQEGPLLFLSPRSPPPSPFPQISPWPVFVPNLPPPVRPEGPCVPSTTPFQTAPASPLLHRPLPSWPGLNPPRAQPQSPHSPHPVQGGPPLAPPLS